MKYNTEKCNTENCINEDWQGRFVGNLCVPCHDFYMEEINRKMTTPSQAFTNHIKICKEHLKGCEIYQIEKKYK